MCLPIVVGGLLFKSASGHLQNNTVKGGASITINRVISINLISGRAIRDKLPECILKKFGIARVKGGDLFQNEGDLFQTKCVITS